MFTLSSISPITPNALTKRSQRWKRPYSATRDRNVSFDLRRVLFLQTHLVESVPVYLTASSIDVNPCPLLILPFCSSSPEKEISREAFDYKTSYSLMIEVFFNEKAQYNL